MFIGELIIALLIALFLTFLLVPILGWERPGTTGMWSSAIFVFFLVFLVSWAGGLWMQPFGWPVWGVYWLPFLVVGVIVALIVAAVSLPGTRRRQMRLSESDPTERPRDEKFRKSTGYAIGAFFWVLVIMLGVAIVASYSI